MPSLRFELLGLTGSTLILHLPSHVVDEACEGIRDTVRRRLPNAEGAGLVLDCSEVRLINSLGITCLLQLQDLCRRQRCTMVLVNLPAVIEGLISRLKLDKRFERAPSIDEAIARIDAAGASA